MDAAVGLVQAYLRVNGYFTIAEYPVLQEAGGAHRTLTDIDILAFRFPGAGRELRGSARPTSDVERHEPDARLGRPGEFSDMLIGEVKEGRARLNPAALDPGVLRAALVRFGCCTPEEAPRLVTELIRTGGSTTKAGHQIRMVVFGATRDETQKADFTFIPLSHVVEFLQAHLREHWDLVRHAQMQEPVLQFLLTLEKAQRGMRGSSSTPETGGI